MRDLRLIKIVDTSTQLTVTQRGLTSSFSKGSGSLRQFFENITPKTTNTAANVLSRVILENRFLVSTLERGSKQASERLYHRIREAIPRPFVARSGREILRWTGRETGCESAERSGAERARGPMFISWAVTSYQSNGARCDFSQGISVCLIEIPYPDPPGLPGLSYANGYRHTFSSTLSHNSHAGRSSLLPVLHSFDVLSSFRCMCALCHHYVMFVVLLGVQLYFSLGFVLVLR